MSDAPDTTTETPDTTEAEPVEAVTEAPVADAYLSNRPDDDDAAALAEVVKPAE